eukprot:CAMPEP_0206037378 /NCGR_PEP_ID=MMETSP1466-20131121/3410_1 /ASSEMBLY_ACC=CAM_ASM_001126 /TAXON_ID=44452 /ORGANISM="Pavlova gyrans, Strain CCMP608" /LENGTH=44 /DNA_ID= /DNA_START= /DNA_END= /DNA_ORIENTATION=
MTPNIKVPKTGRLFKGGGTPTGTKERAGRRGDPAPWAATWRERG